MTAITITLRGAGLDRFVADAQNLSRKARTEMERGLINGGNLLRTEVRHALQQQTGVIRYGTIVKGTRSYLDKGGLAYVIVSTGSGLPIREFKTKVGDSKRSRLRWSKREHWRLQGRVAHGRFGKMSAGDDTGAVNAGVWNAPRTFARSYRGDDGKLYAVLPDHKRRRQLYGPSLPKELTVDQSAEAFDAGAGKVLDAVMERLGSLMS